MVCNAALATGLAFTVLMNAPMLFPNPFFTPSVQQAHTLELLTSNFLYGILLVPLMTWKYGSQAAGVERRPVTAH